MTRVIGRRIDVSILMEARIDAIIRVSVKVSVSLP